MKLSDEESPTINIIKNPNFDDLEPAKPKIGVKKPVIKDKATVEYEEKLKKQKAESFKYRSANKNE